MEEIYQALVKIVGAEYVSRDPEERFIYSRDPGTMEPREPDLVVMPNSTEEVRQIVLLANEMRIPVVPMGGRTGALRPDQAPQGGHGARHEADEPHPGSERDRSLGARGGRGLPGNAPGLLQEASSRAQAFDSGRPTHRHHCGQRADPRLRAPLCRGGLSFRHAQRNGGGAADRGDREDRFVRDLSLLVLPGAAAGSGGTLHRMARDHRDRHQARHQALPRPSAR